MPSWLPGRALFYVAPAIGAVALLAQPWPVAFAFAAGYAFWAVWGWGHVQMRVAGLHLERRPDVVEALLLRLPGRILPVFARMLFVMPATIAVAWLSGNAGFWRAGLVFAVCATTAFICLFLPLRSLDWLRAELAIGAFWGALIVGA